MDEQQRERLGAATGILAVVALVAGFIFGPDKPPGFDDTAQQVSTYVHDNRDEIQFVTASTVLAGVFLLWFLGSLARALRLAEGQGPGRLAAVAFAGGIFTVTLANAGQAAQWAASYHTELDPSVIQGLWDIGIGAFLLTGIGIATFVGASSLVALRTGALPSPLAGFGAALGAYTIVVAAVGSFKETGAFSPSDGALGFFVFFGFLAWVLLTSIVLVRRVGSGGPAPAPPQ
ncbi:MAG: hypothetical protein AABM29_06330 [Actinomycetota bacterium]